PREVVVHVVKRPIPATRAARQCSQKGNPRGTPPVDSVHQLSPTSRSVLLVRKANSTDELSAEATSTRLYHIVSRPIRATPAAGGFRPSSAESSTSTRCTIASPYACDLVRKKFQLQWAYLRIPQRFGALERQKLRMRDTARENFRQKNRAQTQHMDAEHNGVPLTNAL
ncbi:unnamed protein product, partial [Trichogramma brassicae]